MRRYTPGQKAALVSATTLALIGASPQAFAKEGRERRDQTPTATAPRPPETREVEHDDDHDDHDGRTTSVPPVATLPPVTAPPVTPPTPPAPPTTPAPATTKPPVVTTKPPVVAPTIRVSQAFLGLKAGAPIRMDTTISNDAATAANVTVVITMSSTGALPGYLEAKALTGTWTCSAYAAKPVSPQKYTCTGTLAAKSSGAITVSSGSNIVAPMGTTMIAGALVTPGNIAGGAAGPVA